MLEVIRVQPASVEAIVVDETETESAGLQCDEPLSRKQTTRSRLIDFRARLSRTFV